jgi:hypothetical protein
MPVPQVLQALAQRLEFRIPRMLPEAARQLDRDFLGLLFRVRVAEDRFEQSGIQNQCIEVVADRVDMDVLVDQLDGLGAQPMPEEPPRAAGRLQ